ncbi:MULTISPECIES: hypothetical protein [Micromonospora]|uniref:BON domain-containing protein n=1 Tax=Micromonospora gifhornensis TaxID=84594 RepID=A0ABQ4II46_9ACTN|nr:MULTISPECIES: hypothetical protein [Micromonospora]PMR60140.1 hypothetical protein C1A38_15735 [Verrucosispora sp. ts21]GIJ17574.1 hypothetical protein Vgi01_42580 [Micromonospora gifhornensis]
MTVHDPGAGPPDEYVEAEIHRLLTEDPAVAEQGITVVRTERGLVLYGEVESANRRNEILRRVAGRFPDVPITSDIGVTRTQAPTEIEQLP